MKPSPTKEELYGLRQTHKRHEIAELYNVSVSTVRRWVNGYNLQRRKRESPKPISSRSKFDSGVTIVEKAKQLLGDRVTETALGYKLDGRPVNTGDLLKAAKLD